MTKPVVGRVGLFVFLALTACSNANCRAQHEEKRQQAATRLKEGGDPLNKTSVADRVRVYKPDGSLQCGQGKAIPVEEMQKELAGLTIHSADNRPDGLMHPQACGFPTGRANVYEIDRKDLETAIKKGFKEWTALD